uniref:Vacuolar protein sortingassociated protein putative n=1 Tax=Albugo laibachii Nc14 TaxID=890382 RepID=F0WRU0_9STRA|nr:vacuolar protein sortingassociated protein putative [Albugo laibachii Nc14]|eukprot:CCA24056.1 vacuolar protein sortingassociated protein putative [Albugo laibachii Nc14]
MFETLVTGILTNLLGNYIDAKCFSKDRINVAVWSGYVVLHQLELRADLFDHIPTIRLLRGVCGSIELKIPWNRLQSDSVVITIDDLYLFIQTEEDIEAALLQQDEFQWKQKVIEQLYARARETQESETGSIKNSKRESGYAARLINKIVDNIEVHVRHIHFRLHDISSGDHSFALGVTVESVHAQSTTSSWQPSFVDVSKTDDPRIFKSIEVNHFSVYLNPSIRFPKAGLDGIVDETTGDYGDFDLLSCSIEEFCHVFCQSIPTRAEHRSTSSKRKSSPPTSTTNEELSFSSFDRNYLQHHYLLQPTRTFPNLKLISRFTQLQYNLEESQYCDILYLYTAFQIPEHFRKYHHAHKLRPSKSIAEAHNTREWWAYAIQVTLEQVHEKKRSWSWTYMEERRLDRIRYAHSWQEKRRLELDPHAAHDMMHYETEEEVDMENREDDIRENQTSTQSGSWLLQPSEASFSSSPTYWNRIRIDIDEPKTYSDHRRVLEEIERRRSVEDILYFRYVADSNFSFHEIPRAGPPLPLIRSSIPSGTTLSDSESVCTDDTESLTPTEVRYKSWGHWLFGWTNQFSAVSASPNVDQVQRLLPEIELRELFKILEYEPDKRARRKRKSTHRYAQQSIKDVSIDTKRDVDASTSRITIELVKGSITLASDQERNIALAGGARRYGEKYCPTQFLLATFSHLQLEVLLRDEFMKLDISLQSIEAFDLSAENDAFTRLLSRKKDAPDSNISFFATSADLSGRASSNKFSDTIFSMSYETNVNHISGADASLFVLMEPLEMVFSPTAECWGRLTTFVQTSQMLGVWDELEVASLNDIVNLKARTEAKLNYIMENRVSLLIDLQIRAPVIIIPSDDHNAGCSRLVIDLGLLNLRTERLSRLNSDLIDLPGNGVRFEDHVDSFGTSRMRSSPIPSYASSQGSTRQLCDDSESDHRALRWKEEFYDKFSVSISNIHVLLLPAEQQARLGTELTLSSMRRFGTQYPSSNVLETSDFELIKHFSIRMILRTSILPLDATLTRVYLHLDLPALIVSLSIEKYFRLIRILERFEAIAEYWNSNESNEALADNACELPGSPALDEILGGESGDRPVGPPISNTEDEVVASSAGSDDTWFSIASSRNEAPLSFQEIDIRASDVNEADRNEMESKHELGTLKNKRDRAESIKRSVDGVDRKLFTLTCTLPVISLLLKKPRVPEKFVPEKSTPADLETSFNLNSSFLSTFAESYADTSTRLPQKSTTEFDNLDSTFLFKMEGFKIRVAMKTSTTRATSSITAIQLEDRPYAIYNRPSMYVMFACPKISAPYNKTTPVAALHGTNQGRTNAKKESVERVLTFDEFRAPSSPTPCGGVGIQTNESLHRNFGFSSPQKLVNFEWSGVSNSSLEWIAHDVVCNFGSLHFHLDQNYLAELVQLCDQITCFVPQNEVESRQDVLGTKIELADLSSTPPLDLSTSIITPNLFGDVKLTESVRADLENARQKMRRQNQQNQSIRCRLSFYSLSICLSEDAKVIASTALLRLQLQIKITGNGSTAIDGAVGDLQLHHIHQQDNMVHNSREAEWYQSILYDYGRANSTLIFGLDQQRLASSLGEYALNMFELKVRRRRDPEKAQSEDILSSISASIQPSQLILNPLCFEVIGRYLTEGQLKVCLDKRKRNCEMTSTFFDQRYPRSNEYLDPQGSLTPFFDAMDRTEAYTESLGAFPDSISSIANVSPSRCRSSEHMSTEETLSDEKGRKISDVSPPPSPGAISFYQAYLCRNLDVTVHFLRPKLVIVTLLSESKSCDGIVIDFGTTDITYKGIKSTDGRCTSPEKSYDICIDSKECLISRLENSYAPLMTELDFSFGVNIPQLDTPDPCLQFDLFVSPLQLNIIDDTGSLIFEALQSTIYPIHEALQQLRNAYDEHSVQIPHSSDVDSNASNRFSFLTEHRCKISFKLKSLAIALVFQGTEARKQLAQMFDAIRKPALDDEAACNAWDKIWFENGALQCLPTTRPYSSSPLNSNPQELTTAEENCEVAKLLMSDIALSTTLCIIGNNLMSSDSHFSMEQLSMVVPKQESKDSVDEILGPVRYREGSRLDATQVPNDAKQNWRSKSTDAEKDPAFHHAPDLYTKPVPQITLTARWSMATGEDFDRCDINLHVKSLRFLLLPRSTLCLEQYLVRSLMFLQQANVQKTCLSQFDPNLNPDISNPTAKHSANFYLSHNADSNNNAFPLFELDHSEAPSSVASYSTKTEDDSGKQQGEQFQIKKRAPESAKKIRDAWKFAAEIEHIQLCVLPFEATVQSSEIITSCQIFLCMESPSEPLTAHLMSEQMVKAQLKAICMRIGSVAECSRAFEERHSTMSVMDPFDVNVNFHARGNHNSHSDTISQETGSDIGVEQTQSQSGEEFHVDVSRMITRLSFRDLPAFLGIKSSLYRLAHIHRRMSQRFEAFVADLRKSAGANDTLEGMSPMVSNSNGIEDDQINPEGTANKEAFLTPIPSRMYFSMDGVSLEMVNNIGLQESTVIHIIVSHLSMDLSYALGPSSFIDGVCNVSFETWYHNLRLVSMEPLIEPFDVKLKVSIPQHLSHAIGDNDNKLEDIPSANIEIAIDSQSTLEINITDALIATLIAANRSWKWVMEKEESSGSKSEYSTYWIRNQTGLPLIYWGPSCAIRTLEVGSAQPLTFSEQTIGGSNFSNTGTNRNWILELPKCVTPSRPSIHRIASNSRRFHLAIKNPFTSTERDDDYIEIEGSIYLDQKNSRYYAFSSADENSVTSEEDISQSSAIHSKRSKWECIVDVVVEQGCKYFLIRSPLMIENRSASNFEVEHMDGFKTASIAWKTVVRSNSCVPVPVHLLSSTNIILYVRPPIDLSTPTSKREYAKRRLRIPLSEDDHKDPVSASQTSLQTVIKFHRLHKDFSVRPFVLCAGFTDATKTSHRLGRVLTFSPPMVIRNLLAYELDYCLTTPNYWDPLADKNLSHPKRDWEDVPQRLRERGNIETGGTLIWHLSHWDSPLELRIRMKGFEWSDPVLLKEHMISANSIRMKDARTEAFLFISLELQQSTSQSSEVILFVPYWIVNMTGMPLEFSHDERLAGLEHSTRTLAGQKGVTTNDSNYDNRSAKKKRNSHLIHDYTSLGKEKSHEESTVRPSRKKLDRVKFFIPDSASSIARAKTRRHGGLLPGVPSINGLLDLLPSMGCTQGDPQDDDVTILQACYTNASLLQGSLRLRVCEEKKVAYRGKEKESKLVWSSSFQVDQAGAVGEVTVVDEVSDRLCCFGYVIKEGKGQYSRTKVVALAPRIMVMNATRFSVIVCHSSMKEGIPTMNTPNNVMGPDVHEASTVQQSTGTILDSGTYREFHLKAHLAKMRSIRCRISEMGWNWSGAIPISESGDFVVRFRHETTRESILARITFMMDVCCICIKIHGESINAPPYRLENYSLETFRLHQQRVHQSEILLPHHSLDYTWDEPLQPHKLVVDMLPSAAGDNSRPLRIGNFSFDRIQRFPDALGGTLGIEVCTNGPTRVLRFTDARLRRLRSKEKNIQVKASSGPGVFNELHTYLQNPKVHIIARLRGIGVSLVNDLPQELLYLSISSIRLQFLCSESNELQRRHLNENDTSSAEAGHINRKAASGKRLKRKPASLKLGVMLRVEDIQIDNELPFTPFPVLLQFKNNAGGRLSSRTKATASRDPPPALKIIFVNNNEYEGIDFIHHFSSHILPMYIRIDGSLFAQMMPFLRYTQVSGSRLSKISNSLDFSNTSRGVLSLESKNDDKGESGRALALQDLKSSLDIGISVIKPSYQYNLPSDPYSRSTTTSQRAMMAFESLHRYEIASDTNVGRIQIQTQGRLPTQATFKKLYFEEFHIHAIQVALSFTGATNTNLSVSTSRKSLLTVGPLRLLLNAIGTSLTKIANAPLRFSELRIDHSFVQSNTLASRLASHYHSEALRQAYIILGSVDVLGNPLVAWNNLRRGFQHFLWEPIEGFNGWGGFIVGLGRGTLALSQASVFTFFDFNARILTASSLGLSEACTKLDAYTGYSSTKNIYQALVQGLSGVAVAPIRAIELNGIYGLIPGMVAGLLGLFMKPLYGVALAASTNATVLRNFVDPNIHASLSRARPPRHIDPQTQELKIYSYVESLGEEILSQLQEGRLFGEAYVGHIDLEQEWLMITNKRLLFLRSQITEVEKRYIVAHEIYAEELLLVSHQALEDKDSTKVHSVVIFCLCEPSLLIAQDAAQVNRKREHGAHEAVWSLSADAERSFCLQKKVFALPENKVPFFKAMLQQQDRAVITRNDQESCQFSLNLPTQ